MKAKVTRSGARIHSKNSNLSPVIGSVEIGDELDIEAEYGRWVKLVNGGWLKAVYTEPTELEQGGSGGVIPAMFYVQEDNVLYKDEAFTIPANIDDYDAVLGSIIVKIHNDSTQGKGICLSCALGASGFVARAIVGNTTSTTPFESVDYEAFGA